MISRSLALAVVSAGVLSASASAGQPGAYSGTSVNKEIYLYGDSEPRTDTGKVTFTVKSNAVRKFKVKAQQFMCGATTAEIPVAVPRMKLNSSGRGKATYTDPAAGAFEVKIRVRDNGKASGTITPTGLCRGKVTFSAKRR